MGVQAADDEIAMLLARIAQLEAEIKILTKRNGDKDAAIWNSNLTIEKLKAELAQLEANLKLAEQQKQMYEKQIKLVGEEVAKLNAELTKVVRDYADGKSNSYKLGAKLRTLEKELRFKAAVAQTKLETESSLAKGNLMQIDEAVKQRYKPGLDNQLEMLRSLYEQYTSACSLQLEGAYKQKISELEKEIEGVPVPAIQDSEYQTLQIQLESLKLKTRDLEVSNLELESKKSSLAASLEERRKYFNDQISARDKELKLLQDENEAIKKKYKDIFEQFDVKEVMKYSNILTPEISRISRRFGNESSVNNSRVINYSYNDTTVVAKNLNASKSYSSESDSDNESLKTKETIKSVGRNATASASVVGSSETKVEASAVKASVKAESSEAVIKQTTQVTQKETVSSQQVANTKKTTPKGPAKK